MTVTIKRVETDEERLNWVVLEGSVEGVPAVAKRVSIALSALVSNPSLFTSARASLVADVETMHANYLALQALD